MKNWIIARSGEASSALGATLLFYVLSDPQLAAHITDVCAKIQSGEIGELMRTVLGVGGALAAIVMPEGKKDV